MKLFELYQQNTQQGTTNLNRIYEAVDKDTSAVITVGNTQVKIGSNSAKYILGLYETAVANGTSDQFLEGLANLNPSMVMENDNTMRHIVSKFKHEVRNFMAGDELTDDLYHALYDYYSDHGEMPYGVAKARDGDPYEWVTMHFDRDVHDYTTDINPDVPVSPSASFAQESMFEAKKMKEGWDEMMADVKSRAETEKKEKGTGKFDKKTTSTGTVYSRKYDAKSGETEEPKQSASGEEKEKRGRGRPRTRPVADPSTKRGRGRPRKSPAPDASAPKRGRGRPKKVREWIETLRFVSEGAKVDRMVKHIKDSEKKTGKSDKDAESIAYATANKRGMLDNKK